MTISLSSLLFLLNPPQCLPSLTGVLFARSKSDRDHSFKTSACLRGGGVSPSANGPKITVHKDQKSPS